MTSGQDGEYPEAFDAAKAALYWGISPQEAIDLPLYWVEMAAIISTAERAVREKRETQAAQSSKGKRGLFGRRR